MGRCVKFAVHSSGTDHPCAPALSPDAGELSDAAPSIAGCDLFRRRLDHRDQALSGLRGKI